MKICFATNNGGKIREVHAMLGQAFEVLSLKDLNCHQELPETHFTFEENALEKAQFVFDNYKFPCFADDSGLVVDVLAGAPGVFSARYAGVHGNDMANNELLLKNLEGITNRKARYEVVIALVMNGFSKTFKGTVEGKILTQPQGIGGFGYDSLFVPDGYDLSFAELSLEIKNQMSHRGRAVRSLVEFLNSI